MNDMRRFLDAASSESRLRVETDLGDGFVRLRVSEAQKRQARQDIRSCEDAALELLRNARDASARTVFFATSSGSKRRSMTIVDDGDGIPERMWDAIFEPRVTSKLDSMRFDDWGVHGRGMALYSISATSLSARVMSSKPGGGSAIRVDFDTSSVRERSDQSSLPRLVRDGDGIWGLSSSPRNIVRAAADFALSCRHDLTLYFGSPVSIAATLRAYGRIVAAASAGREGDSVVIDSLPASSAAGAQSSASSQEDEPFPPALLLARAGGAEELCELAASLGLELSLRSAYRILKGEVEPLDPLLRSLDYESGGARLDLPVCQGASLEPPRRRIRIADEDLGAFRDEVASAFSSLAGKYYLRADVGCELRQGRKGLTVFIPYLDQ